LAALAFARSFGREFRRCRFLVATIAERWCPAASLCIGTQRSVVQGVVLLACAGLRGLVRRCCLRRRGELSAGAAQGRDGKNQRIESLIIPQFGEVKAYRGRLAVLVIFDAGEKPGEAADNRRKRRAASCQLPVASRAGGE